MTMFLALYLETGVALFVAGLAVAGLVRWGGDLVAAAPRRWLRFSFALLALSLVLPWVWRLASLPPPRQPAVEIWTEPRRSIGNPAQPVSLAWRGPAQASIPAGVRLERTALYGLLGLIFAGGVVAAWRLVRARRRLVQLCQRLPVVKRHGRVRLCASDQAPAPYAARAGGIAYIVVPTGLLTDLVRLRLVLDHEGEHHRRGDLLAAAALGLVRLLFYWNPAVRLWEQAVAELQDLACDRRVLERRRITALDYGRCLLWAAEVAGGTRYLLPGTRAMAASSAPGLRRRILMLTRNSHPNRRLRGLLVGLAGSALLVGTSWAVQGAVSERKMTKSELATVASRIEARSRFSLLVDERVAVAVTRRIATPEARESTRKALTRMRNYRAMIEDVFRRRGVPLELTGVALHESAFDNEARPNRPPEVQSAGIWQFIPRAARELGLEVSAVLDERLEPRRATEAAAGMLLDLHERYRDWSLAIAAYNGGSRAVDALVQGTSIAEARERVLASKTEFGRYLPGVMSAIVLIEDPSLAD